jgi:sulfate transport system permease protein
MAGATPVALQEDLASRPGRDTIASNLIRWTFVSLSLLFLAALLFAPLATVFAMALEKGVQAYLRAFADPDTLSAIRLTLTTAAVVVPINTIFGLAAAWAIAKFEFTGKSFLITMIDLPLAVSPVISGMIYVLLFGSRNTTSASFSLCRASCSRPCS